MRLIIIRRPEGVDILLLKPWSVIRLISRGFGKWLRIFVRTEIRLHAPPADGGGAVAWAIEWNLVIDATLSNGEANTLKALKLMV